MYYYSLLGLSIPDRQTDKKQTCSHILLLLFLNLLIYTIILDTVLEQNPTKPIGQLKIWRKEFHI
jgi:hypothetical protein